MSTLFALLAAGVVFVLIVYLGYLVVLRRDEAAKRHSLALVTGYASNDVHTAIAAAKREDSLIRTTLVTIGSKLVTRKQRERIERNVLFAGRNDPAAADDIIARKVAFLIVGLLGGLLLASAGGGTWWLAVPALALGAFFTPDLLIYNQGLKRDELIAKHQSGPVAEEFSVALQEMQLGRSRAQALEAMAGRTRQQDVQRFVSAMLQVDKVGVPVATVLREQAKEMRAKRYSRAREQAQKVPVKILMPLMLCLLPALFVIILGPAAYSIYIVFTQDV